MRDDAVDLQAVMAGLRDFQRRTAEYIFRRFYTDPEPTGRFLLAHEVGLGKTLTARAVVAQAVAHLRRRRRVQIVYVCSNASIARQNLNRLQIGTSSSQPPPGRGPRDQRPGVVLDLQG